MNEHCPNPKIINILLDTRGGHLAIRSSIKLKEANLVFAPKEELDEYPYTYIVPNYVRNFKNDKWFYDNGRISLSDFTEKNYLFECNLEYSYEIKILGAKFKDCIMRDFFHLAG